jgi:hypothetical protein
MDGLGMDWLAIEDDDGESLSKINCGQKIWMQMETAMDDR